MSNLYRQLLNPSISKAEAIRLAQVGLLTDGPKSSDGLPRYRHPYYWAPFILMGNWR
jgi:CHAT domain-containing protein